VSGGGRSHDHADRLEVFAPDGMPEVVPGDDLARLVGDALEPHGLLDGDVVVVTSKVVSKAEGRVVAAEDREEAITDETVRVVAQRRHPGGLLRIVENRLGLVMAAAGVDASNTPQGTVLLLPLDPDRSASVLRAALSRRFGVRLAVVISDTAGRAWREGVTDIGIGVAGIDPLDDLRGTTDTFGRALSSTITAVADEIAAGTELVRGKTRARPVAVVRGLAHLVTDADGPGARALVRAAADDMFRLGSDEAWHEGYAAASAGATDTEGATDTRWGVVIPVKRLGGAKTRLTAGDVAREELALAFALDTIDAVLGARQVRLLVVVSSEPRIVDALADRAGVRAGVRTVPDPETGLNAALVAGRDALAAEHDGPVALLLGDLPSLRSADLDAVLVRADQQDTAMVADAQGTGTTMITARRRPDAVPRFGPGSRAAHEAAGHHRLDPVPPSVQQDVDSFEDLAAAVRLGVGRATADLLARRARDGAAGGDEPAAQWLG
jgi:coenzyme F420-0:L-glutamate ligase/coenzyme F420-1:gamma-L-glutamate ligase